MGRDDRPGLTRPARIGQTVAAQDLCTGIPLPMKRHHLQTGAGHYGVFSGRRWEREIYPRVREMVQAHE